jgi:phosphoribosylaminoimidazolecarboxamide formyltransferase/IMP cyclohydrolase
MTQYALLSVYKKDGLEALARALLQDGLSLLATGGTRTQLMAWGLPVTDVAALTGEPERFGGRVKTLHHKIFGALLLRVEESDLKQWNEDYRIAAVVCNFYPFEEKVAACKTLSELIEWIDIGGPSMVRAAAKNHAHVWILSDPAQYPLYLERQPGRDSELRERLAFEAFERVRHLDEAIVDAWQARFRPAQAPAELRPQLQYGENPHQKAYFRPSSPDASARFLGTFSYNNLRDAEAAWRVVAPWKKPAVSVIKHQTPCGAAAADELETAFEWAWQADPVSRYGGVLAFNGVPGPQATETLAQNFIELVVLPESPEAFAWAAAFRARKERVGVVLADPARVPAYERVQGAFGSLLQERDRPEESGDLLRDFGMWTAACSKSNSVSLVASQQDAVFLVAAGQGQPNRVDCLERLAWPRAQGWLERHPSFSSSQLVCFSDAFVPFEDLIVVLGRIGVKHLVQPGGSKADAKVKACADRLGIRMETTGIRHFWH